MNVPNDRLLKSGRHAGSCYLDRYERFVGRVIRTQQKLAKQSGGDAIKVIADTQVGFKRGLTSYASAARKLIP